MEAECFWIAYLRSLGAQLLNATHGGEGVPGLKRSKEQCAAQSARRLGSKASPEARARIAAALTGRPVSQETRAKIAATERGNISATSVKTILRQLYSESVAFSFEELLQKCSCEKRMLQNTISYLKNEKYAGDAGIILLEKDADQKYRRTK